MIFLLFPQCKVINCDFRMPASYTWISRSGAHMTLLAPTGLLLQNPPAAQTPLQGRGGTLCTSADIICLGCLFPCPLNSVLPDSWGSRGVPQSTLQSFPEVVFVPLIGALCRHWLTEGNKRWASHSSPTRASTLILGYKLSVLLALPRGLALLHS